MLQRICCDSARVQSGARVVTCRIARGKPERLHRCNTIALGVEVRWAMAERGRPAALCGTVDCCASERLCERCYGRELTAMRPQAPGVGEGGAGRGGRGRV